MMHKRNKAPKEKKLGKIGSSETLTSPRVAKIATIPIKASPAIKPAQSISLVLASFFLDADGQKEISPPTIIAEVREKGK